MRMKKVIALLLILTFALANIVPVSAAGTTATSFPITNIDALKIVMDATGNTPKDVAKAKDWKELYLKGAEAAKIIDGKTFRAKLKTNITREGSAELIAKALKVTLTKKVYFADTKNAYTNTLYELKIVSGTKDTKTGKLYFKPTTVIQKTDLIALATKANIYYASKLPKPTPTPAPKPTTPAPTPTPTTPQPTTPAPTVPTTPAPTVPTTPAPIIPQPSLDETGILKSPYYPEDLVVVEQPRTVAEFENAIMAALASGKLDFTINYPDAYATFSKSFALYNLNEAGGNLFDTQVELFSFYDLINYKIKGTATGTALTIELRNGGISDPAELLKMQTTYMDEAKKVVEGLIKEGKLTATMTEKEKAAVLFEWVCKNVTYDEDTALRNAKATGLSYTGYGALKNKKAVCQGYTSLYNLLCRYVGIRVQSVPGTAGGLHIWTAAILDGDRVWIDVTFGDALGDIGIAWYNFAAPMNESNFVGTHKWDKEKYSEWK